MLDEDQINMINEEEILQFNKKGGGKEWERAVQSQ